MRPSNQQNKTTAQWGHWFARTMALGLAFFLPAISQAATNTFLFTYPTRAALLADGWSFNAITNGVTQNTNGAVFSGATQNTEITDPTVGAVIAYASFNSALGMVTRIPCDIGEIFASPVVWTNGTWPSLAPSPLANQTRNSLFRSLPTNWISARLTMSFALAQNFQQAALVLYGDDDNYLEVAFRNNTFMASAFGLIGPTMVGLDREFYGFPSTINATFVGATTLTLRLDRDAATDNVSAFWSADGSNWTFVGSASQALVNPQIGITVGGSPATFPLANLPNCDLSRLDVITSDTYTPPPPVLVLQPQHLVFNSIQNQPSVVTQSVIAVLRHSLTPATWTVTSDSSWLLAGVASGATPGSCDVSVNTAGLAPGIYQGTLSFAAAGPVNSPAKVSVTLIVNPNGPIGIATWKDVRASAMSVWVDDSEPTAFDDLDTNGLAGTYVMWHEGAPAFYTDYFLAGMELGSHSVDHPNFAVSEPVLRYQLETNILSLVNTTPVPQSQVISFAWPAGFTTLEEETVAADYFLISRGYNINQLENPTPRDFMNVKSFNSHEHAPFPPDDLKTVVDAAIVQGKWFNLVLHGLDNHDGAIQYSIGKDIWVAPGGTVTKYILQRDRLVVTNFTQTASAIQFNCYRLPLDSSSRRSFETALTTNDTLTLTVNAANLQVSGILVNGAPVSFTNKGSVLFFSALITTNAQTIVVSAVTNQPSPTPGPTNLVAIVRHAPGLSGRIEGSLQQLLGEDVAANGGFAMTGDLLVPGTPTLILNGKPDFAGTITGTGSILPAGYRVTLNGGSSLHNLRTRINPVTLPNVPAPPKPRGTQDVTIDSPKKSSGILGSLLDLIRFATLRDLTLNANVGQISVPPGTYRNFTANNGSGFTLGIAGAKQPAVYNLQNLNLNNGTRVDVVGPIILTVAKGFAVGGTMGTANHSSWLQLQIPKDGLVLNGGSSVNGNVITPSGTVAVSGNSLLIGSVQADQLIVNGNGLVRFGK